MKTASVSLSRQVHKFPVKGISICSLSAQCDDDFCLSIADQNIGVTNDLTTRGMIYSYPNYDRDSKSVLKIALYFSLSSFVCWALWRYSRSFAVAVRKALAYSLMLLGLVMAMAIGTATHFVVPGISSIGASAVAGAAIGWGTWLIVGTLGVVPLGIAIGLGSMVIAATGLSILGGIAGGIGFRTVLVPYVSAAIWLPVLITDFLIRKGAKKDKSTALLEDSSADTDRL